MHSPQKALQPPKRLIFHSTDGGTIKAKSMNSTETADAGLGIGASGNLAIADTLTIENTHTDSGQFCCKHW